MKDLGKLLVLVASRITTYINIQIAISKKLFQNLHNLHKEKHTRCMEVYTGCPN